MLIECENNPHATNDNLNCEKCPCYDTCILTLPYDEEVDKLNAELQYYQRQVAEAKSYKNYLIDFIKEFKDEGKHAHLIELFDSDLYMKIHISQPVVGSGNIPFFLVWVDGFCFTIVYQETYSYHIKQVYSLNGIDALVKGGDEYELLRKFILNTNILTDADDLLQKLIENIKTDCTISPTEIQEGVINEILEDYKNKPIKQILRTLRNKRKQAQETINNGEKKIQETTIKLNKKTSKLKKQLEKQTLHQLNQQKNKTNTTTPTRNLQTRKQETPRQRQIYTRKKVKQ